MSLFNHEQAGYLSLTMFVAQNRFKIKTEFATQFETQWKNRESFLSDYPGYIRFRLLRSKMPDTETAIEFVSYTEWIDESSFLNWMNSDGAKKSHSSSDKKKIPQDAYLGPPEFRGYTVSLEETLSHRTDFRSPFMDSIVEINFAKESENQKKIPHICREQGLPPIQIGPFEGRIIELLLRSAKAKKGVEIGTLGGYSTAWLARGVGSGGHIISLELDPKRADLARENLKFLEEHNVKTEVIAGDAIDSLKSLEKDSPFDFVFIDADKARYAHYAKWAIQNLKSGGIILCDNAYIWGGMNYYGQSPDSVTYPRKSDNIYSFSRNDFQGMGDCWKLLETHPELESTILPTGEGLAFSIKK
jgi:predicted O-methyltransferase YrrM/heme-degrading monooxygenase HmoA